MSSICTQQDFELYTLSQYMEYETSRFFEYFSNIQDEKIRQKHIDFFNKFPSLKIVIRYVPGTTTQHLDSEYHNLISSVSNSDSDHILRQNIVAFYTEYSHYTGIKSFDKYFLLSNQPPSLHNNFINEFILNI